MTGREKTLVKVLIISASLNVLMNFIFIPAYGMIGAAGATLFSASGFLLNMTGFEAKMVRVRIFGASANIVLIFLLVPSFGMIGAAAATMATLIVVSYAAHLMCRRYLHVDCRPIPKFIKNC